MSVASFLIHMWAVHSSHSIADELISVKSKKTGHSETKSIMQVSPTTVVNSLWAPERLRSHLVLSMQHNLQIVGNQPCTLCFL